MRDQLIGDLLANQDLDYATFHQRTCPNTGEMIGVRVPIQRRLAKQICRDDFRKFLSEVKNEFYEETLIEGLVIATAKMDINERLSYVKAFVSKIKNWAICDTFCNSFRFPASDRPKVWDFLQTYRPNHAEFAVRFYLIMLMTHFLDEEHLLEILQAVRTIELDKYYVNMAKAWLIAEAFVKFREPTLALLQEQSLPIFVQNKAIQKIRESYRVSQADKSMLLELKIPNSTVGSAN